MAMIVVLVLGSLTLAAVAMRVADARRRAIESLEDADPFEDGDARLTDVKVPETHRWMGH
jgi:hypothetical protein